MTDRREITYQALAAICALFWTIVAIAARWPVWACVAVYLGVFAVTRRIIIMVCGGEKRGRTFTSPIITGCATQGFTNCGRRV